MRKRFLFLACSLFALTACNKELKLQQSWIENELEPKLTRLKSYDVARDEYNRVMNYCNDLCEEACERYRDQAENRLEEAAYAAIAWDLMDLYAFGGGSATGRERYQKILNQYNSHVKKVNDKLVDEFDRCLAEMEDLMLMGQDKFEDDEIFAMLYGTPSKPASPSGTDYSMAAESIFGFALVNMDKPAISAMEYDKSTKTWLVRMDNFDDQFVKFIKRNDGDYDVYCGKSKDQTGTPQEYHVTIPADYAPLASSVKEKKEVKEGNAPESKAVSNKKTDLTAFYGHWKRDAKDAEVLEVYIAKDYIQEWYDAKVLSREGMAAMAKKFTDKTLYDCEKMKWYYIEETKYLVVTDGEYDYNFYKLDDSGKVLIMDDLEFEKVN